MLFLRALSDVIFGLRRFAERAIDPVPRDHRRSRCHRSHPSLNTSGLRSFAVDGVNSDVIGTACFYATHIHKGGLGEGMQDDSLESAKDIHGELLMIWGRQDPHIPLEGRMKVLARLNELGLRLNWHEVNGAHAFMRDEGPRYDPELAYSLYGIVLAFFHRKLGQGDLPVTPAAAETRH